MHKAIVLGMALGLSLAAQQGGRTAQKPRDPKAAAQAALQAQNGLPANAEKVREGVWRAKDPSGKAWIYTKTPFGFSKSEEGALDAKTSSSAVPALRVTGVQGDAVSFERETPFGKSKWTRKTSELNDDERAAYERAAPRLPEKN